MTTAHFQFEKVTREPVTREAETVAELLAVLFEAGGNGRPVTFEIQTGERRYRVSAYIDGEVTGLPR